MSPVRSQGNGDQKKIMPIDACLSQRDCTFKALELIAKRASTSKMPELTADRTSTSKTNKPTADRAYTSKAPVLTADRACTSKTPRLTAKRASTWNRPKHCRIAPSAPNLYFRPPAGVFVIFKNCFHKSLPQKPSAEPSAKTFRENLPREPSVILVYLS